MKNKEINQSAYYISLKKMQEIPVKIAIFCSILKANNKWVMMDMYTELCWKDIYFHLYLFNDDDDHHHIVFMCNEGGSE